MHLFINGKWERIWKEATVAYFKILGHNSPEENKKKLPSRVAGSR